VACVPARPGFDVVGLEVDEQRAQRLAAGDSYIEDVPTTCCGAALSRGYRATADPWDLAGFDSAVIFLPTPLAQGAPDLSYIEDAGRALAPHLRERRLVVLESTTYPGTTEELLAPSWKQALASRSVLTSCSATPRSGSTPGNPNYGLQNTPEVSPASTAPRVMRDCPENGARSHAVIATVWLRISDGVIQPRVCRGRPFSSSATASRWA
jgi:UDP-N-acetyl-D-glucosamine dehydrogenase